MASNSPPSAPTNSGQDRNAVVLRHAATLMLPIAQWLLRSGVPYGAFADLLKGVFVDAARRELVHDGSKLSHSALSVASGVHRKDVRALETDALTRARSPRAISLASQVYTRWISNPKYRTSRGAPRTLPRSGPGISFESLAREVSNDIHPRTVLDELTRLGLVELSEDKVKPTAKAFVPSRDAEELEAMFAANASDHLAAGVHNLTGGETKFLEQSIFASGLSEASAAKLHEVARSIWKRALESMVTAGEQCIAEDGEVVESSRIRFGLYYYSEPTPMASSPATEGKPAKASPRVSKKPRSSRVNDLPAKRHRTTP
jgi:hypothetical protein